MSQKQKIGPNSRTVAEPAISPDVTMNQHLKKDVRERRL